MTDISTESQDTAPEPRKKTTVFKNPWFWAGACVLSVLGSGIAISQVSQQFFRPEHRVSQYFDELTAGRSDKALGLLNAQIPSGDAVLLSGEPFKESIKGLDASHVKLESTNNGTDASQQTVTATYLLNGVEEHTTFALHKTRTDWLFFDHWEFVPVSLPTVRVQAQYSQQATVNGSESPLSLDGPPKSEAGPAWNLQTYPVLPPAVVKASYETEFVKGAQKQQVVTEFVPAKSPQIALGAEASDKLAANIDAQLKKYLDDCAAQQVLKPAGCPMNYDTTARVRSSTIKWQILDYPKAKVTLTPQGWAVERLHGRAKIALEEQDLDTGDKATVQAEDSFDFSATVTVRGNTVTVRPDAFNYDPKNKT